jgi:hypothetical protein
MNDTTNRAANTATRDRLRLLAGKVQTAAQWLSQKTAKALPDIVGIAGLGIAGQGVRMQFGDPAALMFIGGVLLAVAVASVLRGDG